MLAFEPSPCHALVIYQGSIFAVESRSLRSLGRSQLWEFKICRFRELVLALQFLGACETRIWGSELGFRTHRGYTALLVLLRKTDAQEPITRLEPDVGPTRHNSD